MLLLRWIIGTLLAPSISRHCGLQSTLGCIYRKSRDTRSSTGFAWSNGLCCRDDQNLGQSVVHVGVNPRFYTSWLRGSSRLIWEVSTL